MKTNISNVSSQFELPYWWVESIAIEYLNCREYAARNEIWTFNFDLISESDLIKAVKTKRIIVADSVIHYPHLNKKNLLKDLKDYFLGLDEDGDDYIIEGPLSENNFPEEVELLDFWDPKLSFSDYFQVYDGKFWQWEIAELIPINGKSYGKWVSYEIDLNPINNMDIKLREIRNNIIEPGKPGHIEFKLKVENFYRELGNIRTDILSQLWKIHQRKKEHYLMARK